MIEQSSESMIQGFHVSMNQCTNESANHYTDEPMNELFND